MTASRARQWEWLRTSIMAAAHRRPPLISRTHIVHGMSENSTRAPKMRMAAARSQNGHGRRLHEDWLRRHPAELHVTVKIGLRELGHEPFIERPRPAGESHVARDSSGVGLAR